MIIRFLEWLTDLLDEDNHRVSVQFTLSVFCALTGFLASVSCFTFYGIKFLIWPTVMVGNPPVATVADIPANLTAITQVFIAQTVGGVLASVFYKPKPPCPPAPPQPTQPPTTGGPV